MTENHDTPKRAAADGDFVDELVEDTRAQRAIVPVSRRVKVVIPLAVAAVAVAGVTAGALQFPGSSDGLEAQPAATSPSAIRSSQVVSRDQARPAINSTTPTPSVTPTPTPVVTPAFPAITAKATPKPTPKPTVKPTPKPAAAPSRTATPSPSRTASPAASYPMSLGKVTGTRYVRTGSNVRTGPGTAYPVVNTLEAGVALQATNTVINGYRQVGYRNVAVWIKDTLTTTTKPTVTTITPGSGTSSGTGGGSTGGGSTSGGISAQACASGSSVESGLVPNAIKVHRAVCAQWPSITNYGGRRASADNHGSGQALDIMVSGSLGWEVARWVRANASALGVTEVIYSQQIWTTQRSSEGWRMMSDRGSATANHYDHVHVSVR